jgi:hypothetical protein
MRFSGDNFPFKSPPRLPAQVIRPAAPPYQSIDRDSRRDALLLLHRLAGEGVGFLV